MADAQNAAQSNAQPGAGEQQPNTTATTTTATTTTDGASTETVDWQKRFEAQQKVNRDLETKLTEARKGLDGMEDIRAQLAKLQGKEQEFAAEQANRKVEQDALAKANLRIVKAEVKAAAAGKLADAADAVAFLDLSKFDVSEDGEVDGEAIQAAIADLITRKPHLAAKGSQVAPFTSPTSTREGGTGVEQLTREQLKNMTPEQINEAYKKGQVKDLLGGK